MAPDEAPCAVTERVRARADRLAAEPAFDVVSQLPRGREAALGLGGERARDDRREIPVEPGIGCGGWRGWQRRSGGAKRSPVDSAGSRPVMSSWRRMPSAQTSVAVVTGSPRRCSGAARCGVIGASSSERVGWVASSRGDRSLAMPKSSRCTRPSALTRTFDGLRSRWTTRLACANCTARQSSTKSSARRRGEAAVSSQNWVIGRPST